MKMLHVLISVLALSCQCTVAISQTTIAINCFKAMDNNGKMKQSIAVRANKSTLDPNNPPVLTGTALARAQRPGNCSSWGTCDLLIGRQEIPYALGQPPLGGGTAGEPLAPGGSSSQRPTCCLPGASRGVWNQATGDQRRTAVTPIFSTNGGPPLGKRYEWAIEVILYYLCRLSFGRYFNSLVSFFIPCLPFFVLRSALYQQEMTRLYRWN